MSWMILICFDPHSLGWDQLVYSFALAFTVVWFLLHLYLYSFASLHVIFIAFSVILYLIALADTVPVLEFGSCLKPRAVCCRSVNR